MCSNGEFAVSKAVKASKASKDFNGARCECVDECWALAADEGVREVNGWNSERAMSGQQGLAVGCRLGSAVVTWS